MSSSRDTGPSEPYSIEDEGIVEAALDAAYDAWDEVAPTRNPTGMNVTAQIEWAGVIDRARNGVRTTRLTGLNLGALRTPLQKARQANARAEAAQPATSYTAKGWHAQLRALTTSARGSDLADRAGLDPSARTLRGWLAEDRAPSKANQERIAAAYEGLRTVGVEEAQARAVEANHQLAEKLNAVVTEEYGQQVRFRDIARLFFR
ncbi:MAG: hypothetical protein ACRDP6_29265 [Actinoallomurus sp.]